MKRCYVFGTPPAGSVYVDVLEFGCRLTTGALLVVAEPWREPGPDISGILGVLQPFLVDVTRSREWPGTVSLVNESTVYRYRTSPALAITLASLRPTLFDWRHPGAPEDLSFVHADGRPLLVTTSHERDAYLLLDDTERALVDTDYPALAAALVLEG